MNLNDVPRLYQPNYTTSAMMIIHEDCNLACSYCYEKKNHKNRKMSVSTANRSINYLFEQAEQAKLNNESKSVSVTMFGGEPTLNFPVIEECYRTGVFLSKNYGIDFSDGMITNGTLLDDNLYSLMEEMIENINFNTQLSIDGPKHVQDLNRNKKDGSSSFYDIEKNIKKYKKLYEKKPDSLNIHGVLGKNTIKNLYESFVFFKEEWGVDSLWFIPAQGIIWTPDEVKIYDEQMGMITDYILKKTKQSNSLKEIEFYAPLNRSLRDSRNVKPCGVGNGYVTVNYLGDIYPCHQFYFNNISFKDEALKCGDVYNGLDEDRIRLFQQYDNNDMSCPKNCSHLHCYRCIAINYDVNGSILSQDRGEYCSMMKIDQKYQNIVKKEIKNMGLLKDEDENNPLKDYYSKEGLSGPDCGCKVRGDLVDKKISEKYLNKKCKCGNDCDGDCENCEICDGNCKENSENCLCKESFKTRNPLLEVYSKKVEDINDDKKIFFTKSQLDDMLQILSLIEEKTSHRKDYETEFSDLFSKIIKNLEEGE